MHLKIFRKSHKSVEYPWKVDGSNGEPYQTEFKTSPINVANSIVATNGVFSNVAPLGFGVLD